MSIKEYLNSKQFKRDYKHRDYANRIYDERGNDVCDFIDLGDDDIWESFINTHEVLKVEMGWELGSDNESYAFAKIFTMLWEERK